MEPTTPQTEPAPQKPAFRHQCRFIKTDGLRCNGPALDGKDLCWHHDQHDRPRLTGVPRYDRIPFLEDPTSIQLCVSQTIQGVMDGVCSDSRARTIFYGCAVAGQTLRLQLAREQFLASHNRPAPEPVSDVVDTPNAFLAPDQKYVGPTGTFEPQWSMSKYRYEKECERLGKPKPTCADDFPASGWLTEEEIKEDPNDFCDRYEARIRDLREQKEQREATEKQQCDPSGQQQNQDPADQQEQDQSDRQQPNSPQAGTVDLQATAETATNPALTLAAPSLAERRENAKRPLLPHREQTPAIPRDEKPTQPPSTLQSSASSVSSVVKRSAVSSVVKTSSGVSVVKIRPARRGLPPLPPTQVPHNQSLPGSVPRGRTTPSAGHQSGFPPLAEKREKREASAFPLTASSLPASSPTASSLPASSLTASSLTVFSPTASPPPLHPTQ